MPWVRVDDHFDEHPKFAKAGPLGIALWLAGLAYCNRNLTDGYIPWTAARKLLSWEFLGPETSDGRGRKIYKVGISSGMSGDDVGADFAIGLLVDAGLWEDAEDGYQVHDYHDYQPWRDEVLAERAHLNEVRAAAGRLGGLRSGEARRESSSLIKEANAKQNPSKGEANTEPNMKQNGSPVPGPVPGPGTRYPVPGPVPPASIVKSSSEDASEAAPRALNTPATASPAGEPIAAGQRHEKSPRRFYKREDARPDLPPREASLADTGPSAEVVANELADLARRMNLHEEAPTGPPINDATFATGAKHIRDVLKMPPRGTDARGV